MAGRPLKFNQLLESFAGPRLKKEISAALYVGADDVRARYRRKVTDGSISGVNHVPSEPGQPPNNDTGFLISTAETAMVDWNHAQVRVGAPYAARLEYGDSKIAARPALGPATQESRKVMTDRLNRAIQSAARAAGVSVRGSGSSNSWS